MRVKKQDIIEGIKKLDMKTKTVCIHSSLKSFGFLEGGARTIIEAFQEEGFTILVPTFTFHYSIFPPADDRPLRNGCDYSDYMKVTSDIEKFFSTKENDLSREHMGALPYEVLKIPERKRGYHPTDSFTAIGPKAEQLVTDQTARNVYAPFKEMYNSDGDIILMGVGLTRMTAIHYAQEKADVNLFIRWATGLDGKPIRVYAGGCSSGFDAFDPLLEKIEKQVLVGDSLWRVFPMKETIDICTEAIIDNPKITHCGDVNCKECRDAVLGGPISDD